MDFKKFSELILIEQTFFALPFALLGVLFAGGGTIGTWFWVIIAMAAARTAGMSFNRVIDAGIDAKKSSYQGSVDSKRRGSAENGMDGGSDVFAVTYKCLIHAE